MANLNTAQAVRDEGNWSYQGWSPRITSEAAMDTFVTGLVTRANTHLQQRVGVAWYNANVGVAPWQGLLTEAEMHMAQAYLLLAAAQIADTSSDTNPAPFLAESTTLRALAEG